MQPASQPVLWLFHIFKENDFLSLKPLVVVFLFDSFDGCRTDGLLLEANYRIVYPFIVQKTSTVLHSEGMN